MIRAFENGTPNARIHVVHTHLNNHVETRCNRLIAKRPGAAFWNLDPSDDKHLNLIARAMCAHCRRLIAHQLVPW